MLNLELANRSGALLAFQEALRTGNSLLVEELWETPRALLAAILVKATNQSVLIITGSMREDKLCDDLMALQMQIPDRVRERTHEDTLPSLLEPP